MQTLTLEDFPATALAAALSPNGRAHWAQKRNCVALVKALVKARALIQRIQPMVGYVILQPTFIYPVKRKRDDDNLATGVLKAARDGLVEAGLLVADDMEHLEQRRPIVLIKPRRRALILEFVMADERSAEPSAPASAHQRTPIKD